MFKILAFSLDIEQNQKFSWKQLFLNIKSLTVEMLFEWQNTVTFSWKVHSKSLHVYFCMNACQFTRVPFFWLHVYITSSIFLFFWAVERDLSSLSLCWNSVLRFFIFCSYFVPHAITCGSPGGPHRYFISILHHNRTGVFFLTAVYIEFILFGMTTASYIWSSLNIFFDNIRGWIYILHRFEKCNIWTQKISTLKYLKSIANERGKIVQFNLV